MEGEPIWVLHEKQTRVSNRELSLKWAMACMDTHAESFWLL